MFGRYVSEIHTRVPPTGFGITCIPGDDCVFANFGLQPISIGYGLSVGNECDEALQELLDGMVIKDGAVTGRADNREQFHTIQDDAAMTLEATFEKQHWILVFYPEPLWDNTLPASGQVEYNFKTLMVNPACIAVSDIEFFDANGRKLRVNPPA